MDHSHTRHRRAPALILILAGLLAGCAATAPEFPTAEPDPAFSGTAGMVIGTVAHPDSDLVDADPDWVLELERLDEPVQGTRQPYALPAVMDRETGVGTFAGLLPEGLYAVAGARSQDLPARRESRWVPASMGLPIEVRAGVVRDAGHVSMATPSSAD